MVNFIELKETYLPQDGDWYRVSGIIGEEDIEKINALPRKTILVIDNTKGLSSDIVRQITSDNISFSVVGGLDYFNKEKYKSKNYIARTMMSAAGLAEVIKYYESIESQMSPSWTDTQKGMFLYDAIVRDCSYKENYDTQIEKGVAERSLNGILYKKLVCAGFALAYKEGLDRIGIDNIYQNRKGHHSWNIALLDGKWRGLELTWDCYNKGADNICQFRFFGQEENFYQSHHHALACEVEDIDWELEYEEQKIVTVYEEETQYDLTPFSIEELRSNYRVIAPAINSRKVNTEPLFSSDAEEMQMLPIDKLRIKYQQQCVAERYFALLYEFLKSSNQLENGQYDFWGTREFFNNDVLGSFSSKIPFFYISSFNGRDIGIESLADCEFHTNGDYHASFGVKHSVAGDVVVDNLSDESARNRIFNQLRQRLRDYSIMFLIEILNDLEVILSQYQQFQGLQVKKDLNLSIVEADLYTKLQSLILGKDLLLSAGISQEVIEQAIGQIEACFNSTPLKNVRTEEEQKEDNIYFLNEFFGNATEIRQFCEQHEGHPFTEEEWQQKCTNVDYMYQTFDELSDLNIKREEVQEVLNSIFLSQPNHTESGSFGK